MTKPGLGFARRDRRPSLTAGPDAPAEAGEGCNKGRAEAEPDDEGSVMSQTISESGRLRVYLTSVPLSSSGIRRARRDRSVARENSDSAPGAKLPT